MPCGWEGNRIVLASHWPRDASQTLAILRRLVHAQSLGEGDRRLADGDVHCAGSATYQI